MQTSLELTFCSYLTLKYAQFDGGLCTFINISFAVAFAVLILCFPLATFVLYRINFKKFKIEFVNDDSEDLRRTKNISKRDNDLFWLEKSEKLQSLLED